jgi:hypothetical protein
MSESQLPAGASGLLRYFEGVARASARPHWRNGVVMCNRWLGLIAGPATQADIDRFIEQLVSEPEPGSGWLDLGIQFRAWARSQGFRIDGAA